MKNFYLISALAVSLLLGSCGSSSRNVLDGPGMVRSPKDIRESCKLSTTFKKNSAGKVTHINLLTSFVGGETKQVAQIEMLEPVDESFFEGVEVMMEKDLNFDGLNDVQVIKGKRESSLYWEGFVWNPDKDKLEIIDGFDRIPNPSPSTHGDAILGFCDDDPTEMVLVRYEWKQGYLIKVDEERHRLIIDPGPIRVPTEGEPVMR